MLKTKVFYLMLVVQALLAGTINSQIRVSGYLGIQQGLANNSVRSIFQDSKGFMWFGTYDGLSRYDGYGFKEFHNQFGDTSSLASNFISVIAEDRQQRIWLGTRQGISIWNSLTDKFHNVRYSPKLKARTGIVDDVIKDIKPDQRGNMIVATETSGLLFCGHAGFTATVLPLLEKGAKAIYNYGVQVINTRSDVAWVFVQGKGICKLDYNKMVVEPVFTMNQSAKCMLLDGRSIWLGTNEGVFVYDIGLNTSVKIFSKAQGNLASDVVTAIEKDSEGKIWIGADGGSIRVWDGVNKQMTMLLPDGSKSSLNSESVYALFVDKANRKWIGTIKGGVNIVDPQKEKFTTVSHEPGKTNGLTGNLISSFYEDSDSTIWVGADGKGINVLKLEGASYTNVAEKYPAINALKGQHFTSIIGDAAQNIWISTFTNGIFRYQRHTGALNRYSTTNSKTGKENKVVFFLYVDRQQTLWAPALRQGNNYGALYRFNTLSNKFEVFDDNLSDLFVLHEDQEGIFWGGNLNQLVKIDRVGKKHIFYTVGQPVRSLVSDSLGHLWVGTEGGGLVLFDKKQQKIIARYTTSQGLSNNGVLSILPDKKGNLWMSTFNGLSVFNVADKSFKKYYQADGLQGNQYNFNAAIRLRSGAFAFGGLAGFDIFLPDSINAPVQPASLLFTNITVDGMAIEKAPDFIEKISGNDVVSLKLPYDKAVLSFGFTALEYSSPNKISYAYYMDGWDKDWNYTGNNRSATYTRLYEGSYTFRVKITDANGVWSPKEIALKVTILPPWYRSWWAWLLYFAAAGALVYYYIAYKNRQAKLRYEVRLAHLETEKERAVNEKEREMNERKLSFFTDISHEFRTPLTLIINPVRDLLQAAAPANAGADLGIVYRNARRLLSLVDQLLLFRKAESGTDSMRVARLNFYTLCHEVYLCFVQQAKAKNIEYLFNCASENLELYADREKMEIVLYNLVSNALKYTPDNGKVTLTVLEKVGWVEVLVDDTGAGISQDIGEKLFVKFYQASTKNTRRKAGFGIGLYLVKHFTEAHHGNISYTGKPSGGTIFTLGLQKGSNHFGNAIIEDDTVGAPVFLQELAAEDELAESLEPLPVDEKYRAGEELVTERQQVLVVDDEAEIRSYVAKVFKENYTVYEAANGEDGLKLARKQMPDIIISDIKMQELSGIELCKAIKDDPALSHIPVILLTGTSSAELKLEGVKGGADDYITKPFDTELLRARVANLLKNRNSLQQYFFNEITLNKHNLKISAEYKDFLDKCIAIVETHLEDDAFNIKSLASEIGMSYSAVYKKIKTISGQSLNVFIRFIRLRKAAELFIGTSHNVNEVASQVGIYDAKYFREHFSKLFGMNPSEYIKKYRKPFASKFNVNKEGLDVGNS